MSDATKNAGSPLNDAEREREIRERLAAATPGPWCIENEQSEDYIYVIADARAAVAEILKPFNSAAFDDAALIANAPSDLAFLLSLLDDLRGDRARLAAANAKMEDALHPFGEYASCRDAQPLRGLDDVIHAIHIGTPWESEIRLSDCRKAAKVLGYDLSRLSAARAAESVR